MDKGERGRSIGPANERHVDAGFDQQPPEKPSVVVVGEGAEICDRDTEATECDRGVERPTAGHRLEYPVVVDEIDQSFAADDDHDARSLGEISPDPRAMSFTEMM